MKVKCTCCNGTGEVQDWKVPEGFNNVGNYDEWLKSLIYFDIECYECKGKKEVVVEWREFNEDEDVYTMEEFIEYCKCKCFIDYDGFGDYSDGKRKTNVVIKPSHVMDNEHLTEFTHVVWYNR